MPASANAVHPRSALFDDAADSLPALPVCDHYAGIEARMRKSLDLQGELGPVFDLTLDCEDGAPVGGEAEHARRVAETLLSPANRFGRVGARVHPVDHPAFADDVRTIVGRAGARLAYVMVPKPNGRADVARACDEIDRQAADAGHAGRAIPVHVLVETHGALREVDAIAAHPRVESVSFGLMDFVSAHRGAIPASAMGAEGQFTHPLVVRAKLEIAAACHGRGKVPSHCVVTEFTDLRALAAAATRAARELGYGRMWSIHPNQIRPIIEAFAPTIAEVDQAIAIIDAAEAAGWGRIRYRDAVYDRAGYRYFWQVLERAHQTGRKLPPEADSYFSAATA